MANIYSPKSSSGIEGISGSLGNALGGVTKVFGMGKGGGKASGAMDEMTGGESGDGGFGSVMGMLGTAQSAAQAGTPSKTGGVRDVAHGQGGGGGASGGGIGGIAGLVGTAVGSVFGSPQAGAAVGGMVGNLSDTPKVDPIKSVSNSPDDMNSTAVGRKMATMNAPPPIVPGELDQPDPRAEFLKKRRSSYGGY